MEGGGAKVGLGASFQWWWKEAEGSVLPAVWEGDGCSFVTSKEAVSLVVPSLV